MNGMCQADRRFAKTIRDAGFVKNAVKLLGGRKTDEIGRRKGEEEDGGDVEGGRGEMMHSELKIGEKLKLLELLVTLVKGGVEISDVEELMEVALRLEEEANGHIEAEEEDTVTGEESKEEEGIGREMVEWE